MRSWPRWSVHSLNLYRKVTANSRTDCARVALRKHAQKTAYRVASVHGKNRGIAFENPNLSNQRTTASLLDVPFLSRLKKSGSLPGVHP